MIITKPMIRSGIEEGTIRFVVDPNLDRGTVCQIGDYWFYFGGATAGDLSPKDYLLCTTIDDIVSEINTTLECFRTDPMFDSEYRYYYWVLLNKYMSVGKRAINEYGLILNDDTMRLLAQSICEDYSERAFDECRWGFYEDIEARMGCVEYIGDFAGEALSIDDNGADDIFSKSERFSGDICFYSPVDKFPSLFDTAYSNVEDIVNEFANKFCRYLPCDFDYRGNIRHFVGTYYGQ